jgi:hypothetical protein
VQFERRTEASALGRASSDPTVPSRATKNARGAKGPYAGNVGHGSTHEGMAARPDFPRGTRVP